MRRSSRAHAKKAEVVPANGAGTPGHGRPADAVPNSAADAESAPWSGSSSPLSSPSTPASVAAQSKATRARQRAHTRSSAAHTASDDDEDDYEAASADGEDEDPAVTNLLSRAADAIRDEISGIQLADNDNGEGGQAGDDTPRSTRSRAAASGRRRRRSGSQDESPTATPAAKRRSTRMAALTNGAGSGASNGTGDDTNPAATPNGRSSGSSHHGSGPPQQEMEQQHEHQLEGSEELSDDDSAAVTSIATPTTPALHTPVGGPRARARARARATNGNAGDESSDDDESEKDAAGEAKIDHNGYLQGGREFICPLFRSPFRRNKQRQYVLTMDCCRYMGARDSYMLFKQHPRMRRVETTQQERDLLADRMMIPKVTRFRPIALITARTAFREFGAYIVKDGRYITDDYWVETRRREARHAEGTVVANMSVYHSVMAAHAAGMTPGSTRKARKTTPLRPPTGPSAKSMITRAATPTLGYGAPLAASSGGMMVSSWAQLEAQQRMQQMGSIGMASPLTPTAQLRTGSFTMANALQQQQQQPLPLPNHQVSQQQQQQQQPQLRQSALQQPSHLYLHQQVCPPGGEVDEAPTVALNRPVFRKMRAPETAEAAFETEVSAHRAHFADDHGYVDGRPLIQSLATAWPRVASLSNKLRQRRGGPGLVHRTASEDGSQTPQSGTGEDHYGPMAFASSRMARDFNASVRLWREDNGCTWVDPHTGIRQVPANLQPTAVRVERVDADNSRWRRAGKTRIEPLVSFAATTTTPDEGSIGGDGDGSDVSKYPLALLPGQFQGTFPVHRTRYGQSTQQALQLYSYHWTRQLALQQQRLQAQQQQQQQQQQQRQQVASPAIRKRA